MSGVVSYSKVCLTAKVQRDNAGEKEEHVLKWCGFCIQIGSFCGALLLFLIVIQGMSSNVTSFECSCSQFEQW